MKCTPSPVWAITKRWNSRMFSGLYTSPFPSTPPTPNVKMIHYNWLLISIDWSDFFKINYNTFFYHNGVQNIRKGRHGNLPTWNRWSSLEWSRNPLLPIFFATVCIQKILLGQRKRQQNKVIRSDQELGSVKNFTQNHKVKFCFTNVQNLPHLRF